jgi:hypothetical protein
MRGIRMKEMSCGVIIAYDVKEMPLSIRRLNWFQI